jgi:amino acid transporter
MILSVSRLLFAWSKDKLFPHFLTNIHPHYKTPHWAIFFSGIVSSLGILGSHFASDIFLGIDIMVIAMLVNFILICIAVLLIHQNNPELGKQITVVKNKLVQKIIAFLGLISLSALLIINVVNDISDSKTAWYFHATYVFAAVMLLASIFFTIYWNELKKSGSFDADYFKNLPSE